MGPIVRRLREESTYSLVEVAAKLGWDKALLSKKETDKVGWYLDDIDAVALLLKRHPFELVLLWMESHYPRMRMREVQAITSQLKAELVKLRPAQ